MRHSTVGIILVLALGCLVAPCAVEAQQSAKVHRIGILGLGSAASEASGVEALRQGLGELGYVEGRNLTLESRWAEGRPERLAELAAELVRLPVDFIISNASQCRRAAVFIDKILHGARPGDLPMERSVDFELTIDLKLVQELGLTIPESLLLRADKVFPVSGVPLPDRIRIVPPDRRVAPELVAFSGKWVGTWGGDRTAEHILVVEDIDPPHALVILAWGNGTVGAVTAHPWRVLSNWERRRGQFVESTLQVSFSTNSATGSYRLQPDGTLAATHTWRGEVSHATMTRAQP